MARPADSMKKTRTRSPQDYKAEAFAFAYLVGIRVAARDLGLQPGHMSKWQHTPHQQQSASASELALTDENVRLERHLAEKSVDLEIAKKAAVYLAKTLK